MMDGMTSSMGGMGLLWLLGVIALVPGIAELVKLPADDGPLTPRARPA